MRFPIKVNLQYQNFLLPLSKCHVHATIRDFQEGVISSRKIKCRWHKHAKFLNRTPLSVPIYFHCFTYMFLAIIIRSSNKQTFSDSLAGISPSVALHVDLLRRVHPESLCKPLIWNLHVVVESDWI